MAEAISDSFSMVPDISLIAPTDSCVAAWMPAICWPISPVAFAVCSASAFTSEATTAKPRPASPARAASMVAFSAKRLVWPAMVLISSTTSPMRLPPLPTPPPPPALGADRVDGGRHFLGGGRNRLQIGGGFFRGRRNHGGQFLGALGCRGQSAG